MNSVLLLFAHPSQSRSEVNRPLFRASQELSQITCVDLYAEYPNLRIDIDREQQRLRAHQHIIFMFPLYWYSTPAILKEWQDLVLEYGFAYGEDGNALHGKSLLCAITAGGARDAYQTGGINRFSVEELMRPLEQTANLTGMRFLPPFVLHGARTAFEEGRIEQHIDNWKQVLQSLQTENFDQTQSRLLRLRSIEDEDGE